MPHFGLMNEGALGPVEGPRQRARLHLRGARRRLNQGKISAGIVTLFDAVEGALQSSVESPELRSRLRIEPGDDLNKSRVQYAVLVRSGVLDHHSFDFDGFDRLTDTALVKDLPSDFDYQKLLSDVEALLTRLQILPFDESTLPPEDPKTF